MLRSLGRAGLSALAVLSVSQALAGVPEITLDAELV